MEIIFLSPRVAVCAERATTGTAKFSVVQINKKVSNCPFNSMFLIKHPAQSDYITKTNIQSGIKPEDQLQFWFIKNNSTCIRAERTEVL